MRRNCLILALVLALHHSAGGADYSTTSGTAPESPTETSPKQADTMKIRLKIKDTVLSASLTDSKTAQDFVSLLPITLTMSDLFGREKYGHLPRELSEGGAGTHSYLSLRDRSIITVSALIARNQAIEMPYHFNLALDNGVKPSELSEIITHLAFYSGWANAASAVAVAKEVFAKRGIVSDQAASGELVPIDEAAEAQRAARVEQDAGSVAPGVVQYTSDLLFHDLWLRPALAPRDRSLVTVSALIASGQTAQITYHLNRAMDNGLTKAQASEMLTQLAFYAGWPNVFSAIPVVNAIFEKRAK